MVEKYIQTSRGKICYLETEPNLKKIVFFHGGFGQPQTIERFQNLLESEGFQLIAPYLPGHGKSFSLPKLFSYQDLLDCMDEFIDGVGLVGCFAIGHSLGGRLAFDLRNRFKFAIAISPVLVPIRLSFIHTGWALLVDHIKDMGFDEKRNFSDLVINFLNLIAIWKVIKSIPKINTDKNFKNVMMFYGNRDSLLSFPVVNNLMTFEYDCGHYLYVGKFQQEIFEKFITFIN